MNTRYYYTLFVQRHGRYLTLSSLEELRFELCRCLSPRDIERGVIERLITFDTCHQDGCVIKSCGGVSVCRYKLVGGTL